MHGVHILRCTVCLHWNVYVKNTAMSDFYLYENLPNKLTYS